MEGRQSSGLHLVLVLTLQMNSSLAAQAGGDGRADTVKQAKSASVLTKDIIHHIFSIHPFSERQSFGVTPTMGQMLTVSVRSPAHRRDKNRSDPRIDVRGIELLGRANKADVSFLLETVSRYL